MTIDVRQCDRWQDAIKELKKRFGPNKRSHAAAKSEGSKGDGAEGNGERLEEQDAPHRKRIKLAEEVRERPAVCPENQKIVDAFVKYGEQQLEKGHTGKGVTHLRAAHSIRDYDKVIKSAVDAKHVDYVGERMAQQIEQVLSKGKIIDSAADQNVSRDYEHDPPQIVQDVRNSPAKKPENQKLVDALADFGEHELQFGNSGKGVTHLRAAREIRNSTEVITSGQQARYAVGFIGDVMVDKIDQILVHGKIVHDESANYDGTERVRGDPAPIVQDLMENPAKRHENQHIVDRLREYGDNHLHSGHRGKGISHLRAAKEIRNSDLVITSGNQARQIGMIGDRVAKKINQIIHHGHADSDDDYEETGEEGYDEVDDEEEEGDEEQQDEETESSEFGKRHTRGPGTMPPLLEDVRGAPAKRKENQPLVDALADYGDTQLQQAHTGRGVTFLRAAREIRNSREVVTSGVQAKKFALVGNKVAAFIDETLPKTAAGEGKK